MISENTINPPIPQAARQGFRQDINGLRAVAVLLVLLFHFGAPGFSGGFVGVDVFFVISGFLMTTIAFDAMAEGRFSVGGFYYARLVRIYPALVVMIAVTLLFGLVFVTPAALERMAHHGLGALLFVSNFQFWREAGYFDQASQQKWFLHTWSLSVEWQFYLLYPALLALFRRFLADPRNRLLALGLLAAGSLALAGLISLVLPGSANATRFGYFMLPTRAWEMLAGGLVAAAPGIFATSANALRRAAEITGLAMIAVSAVAFSPLTQWPSFNALAPVFGACLVLAAKVERPVTSPAPLQICGAISYSVYLWHWPLLVALAYFGVTTPVTSALAFALSLAIGWLSFRLIETPTRRRLKALGETSGTAWTLASSAVVAAAALGLAIGQGLPDRVRGDRALYADAANAPEDRAYPIDRCGGVDVLGRLRPCSVGSPSADKDVAVVGDSFAEMWFARAEAIKPALADHAVVFITHGGCPAIPGFLRPQPGYNCGPFGREAFAAVREPRFRTVILASMWPAYFLKDAEGEEMCAGDRCAPAGKPEGARMAREALASEVRALRSLGKRVVILTTSPYPSEPVPDIVEQETFEGEPVDKRWSFDFAQILKKSLPIDDDIRSLKNDGAEIVDVRARLCGGSRCPIMRDGAPIYSDAEHLRSSFTAHAGDFLDAYFLGAPTPGRQATIP